METILVSLDPFLPLCSDTEEESLWTTVGEGGVGYFWPHEDAAIDEEVEDDEDLVDPRNLSVTRLG